MAYRPAPSRQELEAAASALLESRRGRGTIPAPPQAGKLATAVLRPLLPETGATLAELKRRWVEIVGERLAGLTEPEKLSKGENGGVLTVKAHASAAPFVQHQQKLIIERANLAGAALKGLTIKQGAIAARASNVRPVVKPLTPAEESAIAAALGAIQHEPLKAALLRLGRAVAAR